MWGRGLLDIGEKRIAVYGAVEHQWCHDAVVPQASDEGAGLAMPVRNGTDPSFAPWRPTMRARHVGLGPSLIDEDQTFDVEQRF